MLKNQLVNNLFNIMEKNTFIENTENTESYKPTIDKSKIDIEDKKDCQKKEFYRKSEEASRESVGSLDFLDLDTILERNHISNEIKEILNSFETNCKSINFKKGIYIYGSPGCGKTQFVIDLLTSLNYDIIRYDAGDVRNKSLIETITSNNISNCNVLQLMNGNIKKIAILMDEIDGMNNGDKGGITSLIKLIRQKKTKKQKSEHVTLNPIICIGNYYVDKKIKELMKVCNVFELKTPTTEQIKLIIQKTIPITFTHSLETIILKYIQGDLVKLKFIINLYKKKPELLNNEILSAIFVMKSYNYDAKKITQTLMNTPIPLEDHAHFMNETDRTIVSLLYHENIIDVFTGTITSPASCICESNITSDSNPASSDIQEFYDFSSNLINSHTYIESVCPPQLTPLIVKEKNKLQDRVDGNITKKNRESNVKKSDKKVSKNPIKIKKNTITCTNHITNIQLPNIYVSTSANTSTKPLMCFNVREGISEKTANFLDFYLKVLDNICYADYIDRITFQNQIWVFNEMTSLIKTFYNNYIYHKTFPNNCDKFQPSEVRFTKVLTKYSTEYNNQLFIYNFCQELNMDKRDMKAFFKELRLIHGKTFYNQTDKLNKVMEMFETLNISKLDVKRIYRFLDKNVKFTESVLNDIDDEEDDTDIE